MPIIPESINVITDDRGVVFEPLSADAYSDQKNAHIVISGPQIIRGNHYHLKGSETLSVMGPALVRFKEDNEIKDVDIPKGDVFRFIFPPGVAHAIKNLSNQHNIIVAFNTVEHDPKNPDTVRDILI